MARIAERVLTVAADVARLEALIVQLSDGDHVSLLLEDGETVEGIVAMRPSAQVFEDRSGREGLNAVVRLEEPALERPMQAGWRDVWVDRIRSIRHLDPR